MLGGADTVIGTAVVDNDGAWSITSSEHLKPATISLSATQVDEAGNESSAVAAEVVVDLTAHPRPINKCYFSSEYRDADDYRDGRGWGNNTIVC